MVEILCLRLLKPLYPDIPVWTVRLVCICYATAYNRNLIQCVFVEVEIRNVSVLVFFAKSKSLYIAYVKQFSANQKLYREMPFSILGDLFRNSYSRNNCQDHYRNGKQQYPSILLVLGHNRSLS